MDSDSQLFEPEGTLHSLWSGLQVLQAGQGPCRLAQGMWIQSDNSFFWFKIQLKVGRSWEVWSGNLKMVLHVYICPFRIMHQ